MVSRNRILLSALALLTWTSAAGAASPSLTLVLPRGGQRGTEMEINLHGARIADAKEILFYQPGISVLSVSPVADGHAKAKIKINADCALGEHPLRLRTASGLTELTTFYVGPFPTVAEKEPNTEFAKPQRVAPNVTVAGVIENEDVDYFVIDAKKGERLSAEVEAIRLGNTLFDPYVAILDQKRFELKAADDPDLALQDGFVSIVAPADGSYIVQVRETSFGGNGSCHYRLHIGNYPRPTAVYPPGGKPGEEVSLTFLGDPSGPIVSKLKLPERAVESFPVFAQQRDLWAPSANRIRVNDLSVTAESEPNDDVAKATKGSSAPTAFHGVIEKAGDVDFHRFDCKKGEQFDIHCYARRLRTGLDSVVTIHDAKGAYLTGADDAAGPDSVIRFQAPGDGPFLIRVTDHLARGSADYVYRVEVAPVKAYLTLTIPQVAQSSQERQTIPVPKGNRYATIVSSTRYNFGGDLVMSANGLPKGVTMTAEPMLASLTVTPVVFEASSDAAPSGALVDLVGKHSDPKTNIEGRFEQKVDLVTAPPNITVYYQTTVDRVAVAVTDEVPFKISIVEPKAPLVQDGSTELKIVAERKPGFTAPIYCYMPFLPPGVGAAGSATIAEKQTETVYPMNANGGAPARDWKIVVIAQATVGNGPVWVSSQLATLKIAPPYVGLSLQMAAAEQGKPVDVVGKVQLNTPFEGEGVIKLLGLPAKVTAPDLKITKDTKEVVFPVKIDAGSPAGQHKTMFCQLTIKEKGEPVLHNLSYGGTLRIDPPPPAPANPTPAPVAQAKPAEPAKPPEKRLTRLEQLRLEAAERAKKAVAKLQAKRD